MYRIKFYRADNTCKSVLLLSQWFILDSTIIVLFISRLFRRIGQNNIYNIKHVELRYEHGLKCPKCSHVTVTNVPGALKPIVDKVIGLIQDVKCSQELTGPTTEIEEEICQTRTGKEARCSWYKGTLTMEIRNIGTEFSFPINNRGCYYAESAAVPANGCHEVSNLNEMKSALDDIIVSVKSDLSLKNFQGTRCLAKETYGDMSSAASYFYKLPLNLVIGNVLVMFVLRYA